MRRDTKQSEKDEEPLGIRREVWLSLLGVALLGILALSLSRKGAVKDPTELSFQVASAKQRSPFAKVQRTVAPAKSSYSSPGDADEIDALDLAIINDRSRWVDPAWLR